MTEFQEISSGDSSGAERPLECTSCRKPIAVRYTEVAHGVITHTVMCKDCPFLEMRLHGIPGTEKVEASQDTGLCCGNCGTTLNAVRSGSFLGCQVCYDVFGDVIVKELESINKISLRLVQAKKGMPLHMGRTPGEVAKLSPSARLLALKEELNETLSREDYEQAAWLRDQIKEISEGEKNE